MTEVVAALIWKGDRFLACQRPAHKARGLLWEFVGGKVEPGETREQALARECREELNITVTVHEVFMELVHEYPDLTVRLSLFNATLAGGEPEMLEHNDLRWITTAEIDGLEFCPADEEILRALKTMDNALHARLYALRDPAYAAFSKTLLPGVPSEKVLGVSIPKLRALAKTMSASERHDFLSKLPHKFHEQDLLHAILISQGQDFSQTVTQLDAFLPYVNNWSVCDTLLPQAFHGSQAQLLTHIRRWIAGEHPYTIRFAIGMLMKFYLTDHYNRDHMLWVASTESDHYYVKMMVAWYFATALAKQYDDALEILERHLLPPWTHNKAIQKAIESRLIPESKKQYLRTLRVKH